MVGRKEHFIFRSAWNPFSQCRKSSKIVESHSSLTRETQESHFLRASVFWLHKYQPHPTVSVKTFMAEGETVRASYWHHKTPSLSHWSSFIHWQTGLGTSSLHQSETRGLSEVVTIPEKTLSEVFISICKTNRLELLTADVHREYFILIYIYQLKVNVCSFSSTAPLVQFEFSCLALLSFNTAHLPFSCLLQEFHSLFSPVCHLLLISFIYTAVCFLLCYSIKSSTAHWA